MDLSPVANPLDEPILAGSAVSGLRVLVNHRPAFRRTFAALATPSEVYKSVLARDEGKLIGHVSGVRAY